MQWSRTLSGSPQATAADAAGNFYVSGSFENAFNLLGNSLVSAGLKDIFVAKMSATGSAVWVKQAGFVFDDICTGLGVDAAGNVLLGGVFRDTTKFDTNTITGGGDDIFVAKLGNNSIPLAPVILSQPLNQTVAPGATAVFAVAASGAPQLQYRWRFNGTNLPVVGSVSSVLTITNALLANVGTYDVVVSNSAGVVISAPVTLTLAPGAPSFGDSFAGAGIMVGFTNYVTGNNSAFTGEPGEPDHAGRKGAHSAWLRWTAPDNGTCEVDTLGSGFDTVLAVYSGAVVSNLTLLVANDDAALGDLHSRVAFPAVAGAEYRFAVDGYSATDAGNIVFRMSFSNAAPIVAIQPASVSVVEGGATSFSVMALGFPELRYQWRFNGADLQNGPGVAGASSPMLALSNVPPEAEGAYSVVVANDFGAVTSQVATLVVFRRPMIAGMSPDTVVISGETLNLDVIATGTPPLSYQWLAHGTNLPGALLPNLTLNDFRAAQAGPYSVLVSNAHGSVTSSPVNVTVEFTLTVLTNGNGRVSKSPSLPSYRPVSVVTLSASPGPGAYFVNWSGNVSGTNNPLTVILTSNRVVRANFASTSLLLGVDGNGTVTRTPDRPFYSLGEQVSLAAVPARWHGFVRWSDGVTVNPRVITISPSNSYTAVFAPTQALETVTYAGVSRTAPAGMPAYVVDGRFVLSAALTNLDSARIEIFTSFPNGTVFYTLDDSPPDFSSVLYEQGVTVRERVVVRAVAFNSNFSQAVVGDSLEIVIRRTHGISVETAGGGVIRVAPDNERHLAGQAVTLTAEATPPWRFLQWLGDATGTNPTAPVVMNRDRCVEAIFGTRLITGTVGSGRVLEFEGGDLFPYGASAELVAVPEPGHYLAAWGGTISSTNNPLRLTVTNALPYLTAIFQPLPNGQHALVTYADGFGDVVARPRGNRFPSGTSVILTTSPEPGQQFLGWEGDAAGSQNSLSVAMNGSKIIRARFTKRPVIRVLPCLEPSVEDGFTIQVEAARGSRLVIEASGNGWDWTPLATLTNLFGTAQFSDLGFANHSTRVYRVTTQP